VPNLKPDRVTVVDQHAKTLSGGDTGMAAEADSRKSEVEQRIAKQVKTWSKASSAPARPA
jgi:flagellar M-ring protein FliF